MNLNRLPEHNRIIDFPKARKEHIQAILKQKSQAQTEPEFNEYTRYLLHTANTQHCGGILSVADMADGYDVDLNIDFGALSILKEKADTAIETLTEFVTYINKRLEQENDN